MTTPPPRTPNEHFAAANDELRRAREALEPQPAPNDAAPTAPETPPAKKKSGEWAFDLPPDTEPSPTPTLREADCEEIT